MNQDELKKLDENLALQESKLVNQLEEIADNNPSVKGDYTVKVPDYGTDETEVATEEVDLERNFAIEQELESQLLKIRTAREKIKNGTYGTCSNCLEKISPDRINAAPVAELCLNCAKQSDR